MKVFKLVRQAKDKFVSIQAKGAAQVEYYLGQWSTAPWWLKEMGYDLCVFEEEETAKLVKDKYEKDSVIVECKALVVHSVGDLPHLSISALSKKEIKPFYSADNSPWPKLCQMMAQSVKPIRIIS